MLGRRSRRQRVRRTRRALLLRCVPLLAVTAVLAALLVAVTVSQVRTSDTAGEPAEVAKREFTVTPEAEREPYTPQDAALVAVADPAVPTIQDGVVVAELAPHDLPSFELLGVTWTGGVPADVAEVQVRWQQDGTWSPWTVLDPEDEPAEGGIPGTEPKWIGPSQAAQARIVASADIDPTGLTLVTVSPGTAPTLTQAALTQATTTQPPITTRAAWGARPYGGSGCGAAPSNGTFQGTIVHHTAGSNNYSPQQSGGIVRSIQAYHMDGQRWCDIGYNFLIDRYGQIFEGRAGGITKTPYGAHAGNSAVNANTTGISLMGEFTSAVPPLEMTSSLVRLATWRHSLFGVPAKGSYSIGGVTIRRIDGHRSVKSTACPGNQVFGWLNGPGGMADQVEAGLASVGTSFVKTAADPKVYLLVDGTKHHVVDGAEFAVLAAGFGGSVRTVDAGTLNAYPTGTPASRYVRDQSTQTLYLLQSDGTKHRFPSTDLVDRYGYRVNSFLPLSAGQVGRFRTGDEVGPVFSIETGAAINLMSGWQRRPITTNAAWVAVRGSSAYVAQMSAAGAARYSQGPAVVEAGVLVKEQSKSQVYLSSTDLDLTPITSFDIAADLGVTRLVTIPDGLLATNPRSGPLAPAVTCAGAGYLAGNGRLATVGEWESSGLRPLAISAAACPVLGSAAAPASTPLFVQVPGQPHVFVVVGGERHHVRSWSRLLELAGGATPSIVSWRSATAALVPQGAPELDGTYVQFAGGAEIYRGSGRTIQHVTSYAALLKANGGKLPPIEQLSAAQKAYYTAGSPIS